MPASSIDQDRPYLTRRSPHSFTCWSDLDRFAAWLNANGFTQVLSRSITEHSRWERSQRLVIIYASASIVVSGKQPAPAIALLDQLAQTPVEQAVLV